MAFTFYKQADTMDCGPTCLRMVAKSYGRSFSSQLLRERTQIGKEGVNLLGIAEAAESIGFRTQACKLDYQTLTKQAALPAILYWDQNHFVVLYRIKGKKLFVADPGKGMLSYTPEEFQSHWVSDRNDGVPEGVALILEPSQSFFEYDDTEINSKERSLRFSNIFRYITRYKKMLGQLIIGLIVGSLLQLILPFLTQSIVDTGINTKNIHFVYIVLIAQLALVAGRLVIEFMRGWILLHLSTRINIAILTDFLIKLMKLPVSFFDSKHTGDIMQRMNDHKRIETFLTGSSLQVLFSLINLVIFTGVLAVFNIRIFLVFIVAGLLYGGWVILFLKKRKILDYKRFDVSSKVQSTTIHLVQGMQEIKLNGAERHMRWAWERLQVKLFSLGMKGLSLNQWQQTGGFFINEGKNILITFLSAKSVIDGEMTLGSMLAIQYIIGQLNSPIEQLIGFAQNWQNAKISMDRLNEIHAMEDEEPSETHLLKELPRSFTRQMVGGRMAMDMVGDMVTPEIGVASHVNTGLHKGQINEEIEIDLLSSPVPSASADAIHFQQVTFTYPGAGNQPVLKDINVSIPKGKTTAIVGVSGSGKTTLLKLLLRFYQPQRGEIKIGNYLLGNISHGFWRSRCGVVMQESYIFSDTIAKNIAVGQEKVDMNRLHQAAVVANVIDFIESLPLGFNTKIGQEGMGISMGQKQRILIARAVYRDPDFIFFDEATNSLDANNETIIINNLNSFFQNRTVVVVAHRLSTVRHADQIIVLNKGVITERGTHQELSNLKGEYYKLVKNQLELGE